VRDSHFRIDGPVVGQLAQAFWRDWAFVKGEDLEGRPPARRCGNGCRAPARAGPSP
jgi:phosphatidylserine/phosphatidylglycerophosphate/cardiolipin synthase-like enzyme